VLPALLVTPEDAGEAYLTAQRSGQTYSAPVWRMLDGEHVQGPDSRRVAGTWTPVLVTITRGMNRPVSIRAEFELPDTVTGRQRDALRIVNAALKVQARKLGKEFKQAVAWYHRLDMIDRAVSFAGAEVRELIHDAAPDKTDAAYRSQAHDCAVERFVSQLAYVREVAPATV
jgi:hypothetical protein